MVISTEYGVIVLFIGISTHYREYSNITGILEYYGTITGLLQPLQVITAIMLVFGE